MQAHLKNDHFHSVQLYKRDEVLMGSLIEFVKIGLSLKSKVGLILSEKHRDQFLRVAEAEIPFLIKSLADRSIQILLVHDCIPYLYKNEELNFEMFSQFMASHFPQNTEARSQFHLYGEIVNELFYAGKKVDAATLENFWNQLIESRKDINLHCAYFMDPDFQETDDLVRICKSHSHHVDGHSLSLTAETDFLARIGSLEMKLLEVNMPEQSAESRKELIRSGHLGFLSEICAGIVHELNNPLSAVQLSLESISNYVRSTPLGAQEKILKKLEVASQSTERMAALIKKIGEVARGGYRERTILDLKESINAAIEVMQTQLQAAGIELDFNCPDELFEVHGDKDDLLQIFLNLIANARDAILELKNPRPGRIQMAVAKQQSGHFEIVFSDNGVGMNRMAMKKIFSPFFTTKPSGKGTGLGLALVQRSITNLGGNITVDSTLGEGTTFRILIPENPLDSSQVV